MCELVCTCMSVYMCECVHVLKSVYNFISEHVHYDVNVRVLWYICSDLWVDKFMCVSCVCECVRERESMCEYVWLCGVVVVSWAQGPRSWVQAELRQFFHLIFHLPPTSPTGPPSCDWVPGICWGANSRPYLMKQQWSRWDFGCSHHLLWGKACSPASS